MPLIVELDSNQTSCQSNSVSIQKNDTVKKVQSTNSKKLSHQFLECFDDSKPSNNDEICGDDDLNFTFERQRPTHKMLIEEIEPVNDTTNSNVVVLEDCQSSNGHSVVNKATQKIIIEDVTGNYSFCKLLVVGRYNNDYLFIFVLLIC